MSCPDAKLARPKTSDETKKQLSISISFRKHYHIKTSQGAFTKEKKYNNLIAQSAVPNEWLKAEKKKKKSMSYSFTIAPAYKKAPINF